MTKALLLLNDKRRESFIKLSQVRVALWLT